jgi:C_GCAxxG_C_C family probable redox protein
MWEAYELGNEDLLWPAIAFNGGIAGQQQAPCGAVSASAVCLGLRHRCSLADKEKAQEARDSARQDASEVVRSFTDKFGTIICRDLLGFDFSDTEAARRFREEGIWREKCDKYVQFIIEKLYELDSR